MKKLLLILLCLPMIGFGQTSWTPCDSSFLISINSQDSIEVVYSVSGPNFNMNSNFSWVYFNMIGQCIGGSNSVASHIDTLNALNINNITDSTAIMCLISDSLSSCIVVDTLVFDSLSGWSLLSAQLSTSQTYVPDDNFEAYLEANGMGNGIANDDSILISNIYMVTNLDVSNQNISDLTGIEDFTLLTSLNCQDNQIINLDLTHNYQLEFVACYNNQLNFLDINGLYALWNLDCGNNNLTYLDVNSNITLQEFSIYDNQITSLDLSNNIYLGLLAASNNQLLNIDVSNNIYLTELSIYANNITSLNIADNINLLDLKCDFNQLTNLDVSNNPNLTHLYCAGNQITNLDISQNADLTFLSCGTNPLTTLDLSNNLALTSLDCFNGHVTNLDLSNNAALIYLICTNGQLQTLNLKNGNNYLMNTFFSLNNPNLSCINVDDEYWSTTNWMQIDSQHYFSNNCSGATSIQEHTVNKELLKVTDLLGRETKQTNQPLLYIYDDGTVEKKLNLE